MPWLQVSIATTKDAYASIEETLWSLGAQSVTLADDDDKPILEPGPGETPVWIHAVITGLFDDKLQAEILREQIIQHLDNEQLSIEVTPLEDQDWTRAWMDAFQPMQFGQRLWVCPQHLEPPDSNAVNLRLDPGLAFGTGTHPTTSLCLSWLDANLNHKNILDYGCGSGILAIAALLLGADHADCVDIDFQALQATQDNAKVNAVLDRISTCKPEKLATDAGYDLVLANILSGPLTELAPTLARHVLPGGDIVLSGILNEQADAVRHAYSEFFDMNTTQQLDDWVLLHGHKPE